MNYQETVEYLFTSTPVFEKIGAKAYKPGLDTMYKMDEHFGHPHNLYKCIHIAGTNGKGSSSHTLAAILQSQGYKVGLFTSPHLVDFRERIRVNGEMVSEEYVIDFVENNRKFFEPLHPSFFELTTMMAFQYFAEQKVDFAVIEVGLGGDWTVPTSLLLFFLSSQTSVLTTPNSSGIHSVRLQAKRRASSNHRFLSLLANGTKRPNQCSSKKPMSRILLSILHWQQTQT